MSKYLVYPKGYDPVVAGGPPGEFYKTLGFVWTKEETEAMKDLGKQSVVSTTKPGPNTCYMRLKDENSTNTGFPSVAKK